MLQKKVVTIWKVQLNSFMGRRDVMAIRIVLFTVKKEWYGQD